MHSIESEPSIFPRLEDINAMNRKFYEQRARYLSYLVNDFILWHLGRVRQRFDGDLDSALILGEIAHYNVQKLPNSLFTRSGVYFRSGEGYYRVLS